MGNEFHFLRPWWLAALPLGVALIVYLFRVQGSDGGWRGVVDRALQPFVLRDSGDFGGQRWPLVAALTAWSLATVALAGPAWERLPVPAFRSNEARVVALDLSRSMDAADLSPSRLARAKLKLLSLLDRRQGGQTGLVVFSTHAFTVTPLTTDTATAAALVTALSTDIMPTRGSRIAPALEQGAELIRRAGVTDGRILLMTDGDPSASDLATARALRDEGIGIDVLAVGTEDGGPIPALDGGFLTDRRGSVVVPRLDVRRLAQLAEAGGGRFSLITADDSDLERLEPPADPGALTEVEDETRVAEAWRDAGLWLTVLLLPLLALGFRRGWVAVVIVCVLVPRPDALAQTADSPAVEGAESGGKLADVWRSLWQRPDQRGLAALEHDRPARAAELFDDPEWRAAAQYRAGNFDASAAALGGLDTAKAHYNRGNALARSGELHGAIDAYERALELDPAHDDARYNRDLLEELLEQLEPPEQQAGAGQDAEPQEGDEQGDGSQEQQADAGEPRGESGSRDEASAPGEQQAAQPSGDASQSDDAGEDHAAEDRFAEANAPSDRSDGADREAESLDPEAGRDAETEADFDGGSDADGRPDFDSADEFDDADGEHPVAADELERWASDQAAEQWLRRIPQDPGGLLRRKFLYQYQRLGVDQSGNYVYPENETNPW